jgi:DNA repair protein RadD
LWRRSCKCEPPPADLLIVDEGHHCPAFTYREIIARYPDAILLGLTATPCRGDGRGLGGIFERLIESRQVADLIRGGWLVRTRVYAPVDPDLTACASVTAITPRPSLRIAWTGRS